jgi:hypothetical protein
MFAVCCCEGGLCIGEGGRVENQGHTNNHSTERRATEGVAVDTKLMITYEHRSQAVWRYQADCTHRAEDRAAWLPTQST